MATAWAGMATACSGMATACSGYVTPALVENARASAEVTHAHPEGQAGAIAVAAAAAFAWRTRGAGRELLDFACEHAPVGATRDGIAAASGLLEATVTEAAERLGSGVKVLSHETVPFSLWCAARHLDDYEGALWEAVAGLGDVDTVCAIVGGIVVLRAGFESIPAKWRAAREALF